MDPDLDEVVSWVSTMMHCQMREDISKDAKRSVVLEPFEEHRYTCGTDIKPSANNASSADSNTASKTTASKTMQLPTLSSVYQFLKKLLVTGKFPAECCIILLIYVNRLIGLTNVAFTPSNWKPISVIALLLAQKVWDDDHLGNDDFALLYPTLTVAEVNFLERKFIQYIEFKLGVRQQLYAQYYFELRQGASDLHKTLDRSLRMFDRLHLYERKQLASTLSYTDALTYQYYRNRKNASRKPFSQTLEDIIPKLPSNILV